VPDPHPATTREALADGPRDRLHRALGIAAVGLPLLLLVLPLAFNTDNVHLGPESAAYDRLVLGRRTFGPLPGTSIWSPSTWTFDTNFPLGTPFVFGIAPALRLDDVIVGRLLAFLAALGGLTAIVKFHSRQGVLVAGSVGAAFWLAPSVLRGAMVSGEESFLLAAAALAVLGIVRRGRGWTVASILAANAMVLFRLDAILLLPAYFLAAVQGRGLRQGTAMGLASGASTLLHLGTSWSMHDDALAFAHLARNVAASAGSTSAPSGWDYPALIAEHLGGPLLLVVALAGLVVASLRGGREGRVWSVFVFGTTVAYGVAEGAGFLNLTFARYVAPLLAMLGASVPLVVLAAPDRRRVPASLAGLALVSALLVRTGQQAWRDADEARLPLVVRDGARWLDACARGYSILVTSHAPEIEVEANWPPGYLHHVELPWNWHKPRPVARQLRDKNIGLVFIPEVGLDADATVPALGPEWEIVWRAGDAFIRSRASGDELARQRACLPP